MYLSVIWEATVPIYGTHSILKVSVISRRDIEAFETLSGMFPQSFNRSYHDQDKGIFFHIVIHDLGQSVKAFPVTSENIIQAIASCIFGSNKNNIDSMFHNRDYHLESFTIDDFDIPAKYSQLATSYFQEPIIPIQRSPLKAESLSNLLKTISGVGIGAYIGYLIVEPSPLLFISVPAGMIVCGAAAGIATGLEEGLKKRVIDILTKQKDSLRSDENA